MLILIKVNRWQLQKDIFQHKASVCVLEIWCTDNQQISGCTWHKLLYKESRPLLIELEVDEGYHLKSEQPQYSGWAHSLQKFLKAPLKRAAGLLLNMSCQYHFSLSNIILPYKCFLYHCQIFSTCPVNMVCLILRIDGQNQVQFGLPSCKNSFVCHPRLC